MPQYDLAYNPTRNAGSRFAWNDQTAGLNPAPPNASWTQLAPTAHSQTAAYNVGALTISNGKLFSAIAQVSAPAPTPSTFVEQARWNAGHAIFGGEANYIGNTQDTQNRNSLRVNTSAASGNFSIDHDTSGTWRLRQVGGGSITGALTSFLLLGFIYIRIGTAADMQVVFGNADITSGGQWILERVTTTPGSNPLPENDSTRWSEVSTSEWNAYSAYQNNQVVSIGTAYYRANAPIAEGENEYRLVRRAQSGTSYTEIGRWNDQSNYRTTGDADWTNFSGGSWCANRGPLNGVADPFPLNSATTYRLRYVQGGAATQANAQIVGTPTQAHIDSSPGGGIWCGRFGTSAAMIAAFGAPVSNPGSPPSFHGGQWILETVTQGSGGHQLLWIRRSDLQSGDQVIWEYDTTASSPNRLKVRTIQ